MFEVGKSYRLVMIENGGHSSSRYEVVEYQHPLLKVKQGEEIKILNLAASSFQSAQEVDLTNNDSQEWIDSYKLDNRKPPKVV